MTVDPITEGKGSNLLCLHTGREIQGYVLAEELHELVAGADTKPAVPQWQDFRFTAKNSVGDISPQTPTERDADRVDQALDCFGNLAVVSRSINSEYGNMPFNEKRSPVSEHQPRDGGLSQDGSHPPAE